MRYYYRLMEETLDKYLRQFKVVLITGPRQVGKSTMLKNCLLDRYEYVTLDDINELDMAKNDPAQFLRNHPKPIIIDEVQYAPELFRQIKWEVDRSDACGQYCLTGSQTYELMKNVGESLSGRIGVIELSSMSFREMESVKFNIPFVPTNEYLEIRKQKLVKLNDVWETIHRGSMPALLDKSMDWTFFYGSYVKSYIERDVRDVLSIRNVSLFYKFLTAMAARTGELFIPNDIANSLGVSLPTVQAWTSVLEASGLIKIVQPYANNALKRATKTPKLYFMDTGLVCYLVGWNNKAVLMNGAMAGSVFETFVVSEIIKSYKNAGLNTSHIFFYRDREQKEIDLVIENGGTLYPIEIKKSAQPATAMAKNFPVLNNVQDRIVGQGCIICLSDSLCGVSESLTIIPVEYC